MISAVTTSAIRVGIGGWTYEPWRGTFYPDSLPRKRELEYAAARLTAIEVNATFYSGFKPATFAGWRDAVPDGFAFALKASRYCTNRKVLAEAGPSIERFVGQGIVELGDKLGPILWQFMPTKAFDPADMTAFLALLPLSHQGVRLRHAVHVRHESFACAAFVDLCRAAGVAIVFADSGDYPAIADISGDLAYVRLEAATEEEPAGYSPAALDQWAATAKSWSSGTSPDALTLVAEPATIIPRDTYSSSTARRFVRPTVPWR
jgi:uncharacterized protein YecE (DUF72 family)